MLQVRCAKDFIARIDRAADYEGLTRSGYVLAAVADWLKKTERDQQRVLAAADYAARKAAREGAPL
jgi:uncharacterized protein (DUF1778 family)